MMQCHGIENTVQVPFLSGLADHEWRSDSGYHVRSASEAKSTESPTLTFDHVQGEFRRFDSAPQRMVNCPPFGASAMNNLGLGTYRLRWKLRVMSDEDLWWLFLHHRPECTREFWEELENRKAAGILSKDSPFWTVSNRARYLPPSPADNSNLVELTREEWEARRRRKMFRLISA